MWENEVVKQLYLKICTTKIGMNHDINSCIYQNSFERLWNRSTGYFESNIIPNLPWSEMISNLPWSGRIGKIIHLVTYIWEHNIFFLF